MVQCVFVARDHFTSTAVRRLRCSRHAPVNRGKDRHLAKKNPPTFECTKLTLSGSLFSAETDKSFAREMRARQTTSRHAPLATLWWKRSSCQPYAWLVSSVTCWRCSCYLVGVCRWLLITQCAPSTRAWKRWRCPTWSSARLLYVMSASSSSWPCLSFNFVQGHM